MSYVIGNYVRVSASFRDAAGQLADPTAVSVVVRPPSGALRTISATKDGVGLYHADVLADVPGSFSYRVVASGAVVAATEGRFVVDQPLADFVTP